MDKWNKEAAVEVAGVMTAKCVELIIPVETWEKCGISFGFTSNGDLSVLMPATEGAVVSYEYEMALVAQLGEKKAQKIIAKAARVLDRENLIARLGKAIKAA